MSSRYACALRIGTICLVLQGLGCSSQTKTLQATTQVDLRAVAASLAGSFSSADQAAADTSYFDIRLRMAPIWTHRTDGPWLYVEQAVAAREDRPYRQRVYRLRAARDGTVESQVYTLRSPLRFAGAWRDSVPLASLTPDSLEAREGCSIVLRRTGPDRYEGSTIGNGCPSDLRGASYATSIVLIESRRLVSWDRGYDAEGKQVWGAEKGGYVFIKLEDWSDRLAASASSR